MVEEDESSAVALEEEEVSSAGVALLEEEWSLLGLGAGLTGTGTAAAVGHLAMKEQ